MPDKTVTIQEMLDRINELEKKVEYLEEINRLLKRFIDA